MDQVWQIIYRDYLDYSGTFEKHDWIDVRKKILSKEYENPLDAYDSIRGMLSSLNDPYTRFLDPKEFKEMRIDTSGELMGVGIQISLDKDTNQIIVIAPIQGTPAHKAGLKPMDIIVSIDENPTKGMSIENAVKLIRGRRGTEVKLGLVRNNNPVQVVLIRERIQIKAVESKLNRTNEGIKIGYIRLKQFNANSVKEMRSSMLNLEKDNVKGYILDLRGNPGGLLEASIEIARQWLNEGIIVSTQTRDQLKDIRRARGKALTKKPLIVLINQGSASASEILAGSIQDNNRGLLVGEKTFGKGLVQSVRALTDGSGLMVTIARYLTPKGRDINKYGIYPDIRVKSNASDVADFTVADLATVKDNQYIVAENELVRIIKNRSSEYTYNPNIINISIALATR